MPISTLFPKLASPILLLCALAVGGCMSDQPNGKSVADSKTRDVVSVFEQGCLNPKRSMRQAIDVFEAADVSHRVPFTRGSSSRRATYSASFVIGRNVAKPNRGDRTWDTKMLTCRLKRVGVFAPQAQSEVMKSLVRQGFAPLSPPDGLSQTAPGRYEGVYRLGGQKFDILVFEQVARNPKTRQSGNVRYIRGNSYTILKINETK